MMVAGLRVRIANAADLAEVIALERGAAEAPALGGGGVRCDCSGSRGGCG